MRSIILGAMLALAACDQPSDMMDVAGSSTTGKGDFLDSGIPAGTYTLLQLHGNVQIKKLTVRAGNMFTVCLNDDCSLMDSGTYSVAVKTFGIKDMPDATRDEHVVTFAGATGSED